MGSTWHRLFRYLVLLVVIRGGTGMIEMKKPTKDEWMDWALSKYPNHAVVTKIYEQAQEHAATQRLLLNAYEADKNK